MELKLVNYAEVSKLLDVSEKTIRKWHEIGNFPKPIKLGKKSLCWFYSDIIAWLEKRRSEAN